MQKSAKEVMQDAMFSAVVEAVNALRRGNVDNVVIREIKAMHGNTSFNDLPESVRSSLRNSVDQALIKLNGEGYTIASK